MISTSGNIIIVAVTLSVIVCASPARLPRNQDADSEEKESNWERELLELRPYTPGIYTSGSAEEEVGMDGMGAEINTTGYYPERFLPYALPPVPYTIPPGGLPPPIDTAELELHTLPELYGPPPGEPYLYYPDPGRVEYDPFSRVAEYPTADPLVESLAYFLANPQEHWESSLPHQIRDEIDFGDVWEVDAVRRIGKQANVPQYLIDSVDPEADENLLELMVRIAENPEKWRSIHSAIERLDHALDDKTSGESSYEAKEVEKRSSGYHHRGSHSKRKKLRKRKKKRGEWGGEEESEEEEEEEDDGYTPEHRGKSHGHRSNPKKIRHSSGEYSSQKPRSAAYASVVFPDDVDNNFDRWKVRYEPVEPGDVEGGVPKDYKHPVWPSRRISDYNRYAKKKLKMMGHVTKSQEKEKAGKNEEELKRWQLLKMNTHLVDKWTKVKSLARPEGHREEEEEEALDAVAAKEKSLATNSWVTPKEQKENWPHFAYHRVTSSPSVQQRDAGAQPRHRSAYVAVSVVPTNSTGSSAGHPTGVEAHHHPVSNNQKNLPDLLDQILQEPITSEEKMRSLKGVEDKFHMGNSERLRLEEVMRDSSAASNRTT